MILIPFRNYMVFVCMRLYRVGCRCIHTCLPVCMEEVAVKRIFYPFENMWDMIGGCNIVFMCVIIHMLDAMSLRKSQERLRSCEATLLNNVIASK